MRETEQLHTCFRFVEQEQCYLCLNQVIELKVDMELDARILRKTHLYRQFSIVVNYCYFAFTIIPPAPMQSK